MRRLRGPSPSAEAKQLADEMAARDEIMRAILEETIPEDDGVKVHESGRTICGENRDIKGPLARFPSSVELDRCPRGVRGGTWHTHVTKSELRNPSNSLPDTANVVFGPIDVSAVVGTQSMEMVIAPDDREAAQDSFRNIMGAEVDSTDDVIDAVISGQVPDPSAARKRVRKELGPLFERRRTKFSDLDSRLNRSSIPASSVTSFEMQEAQFYARLTTHTPGHRKNPVRDPAGVRSYLRRVNQKTVSATEADERVKDVGLTMLIERVMRSFMP